MFVVVCDDDMHCLRQVCGLLGALPSLGDARIEPYHGPDALLEAIDARTIEPDIAVLDIRMQRSGLDIARRLNGAFPCCQVIFVTGVLRFATQVYDVDHAYFVLKDELAQRLPAAVDRALARMERTRRRSLAVSFNSETRMVPIDTVRYIERVGRRTQVCSSQGAFVTYDHPKKLLSNCPDLFVRCHSSYYVNPNWVESMAKASLVLRGGAAVPMSRTYAADCRRALLMSAMASDL